MDRELLSLVRTSISDGYLPENWHENKDDVIQTYTGYLSLSNDCVLVESDYYHQEKDSDEYVFDKVDQEHILYSNCIRVLCGLEKYFYTHENHRRDYFLHRNEYYDEDGLQTYDLVRMVDGSIVSRDDVYYWESDGEYHWDPEDNDELWTYHEGPCPPDYRKDQVSPGIGFEIEKGGTPEFCGFYNKYDLFDETGCVMEEDGSVDWELKTPVYPLFSERIENKWLLQIEQAINADNHNDAGGHIHLSLPPKPGWQLFDYCRPYLPLFMSMYPNRLESNYCKGKPELQLKRNGEKHQAIKIWDNRIELRFPAKVYDMKALVFRLNFCRLMIEKDYKNILSATLAAFDKNTKLSKLVMEVYQRKELDLLTRVIHVAKKYFNTDLLKEKTIETLLKNLKTKESCASQS